MKSISFLIFTSLLLIGCSSHRFIPTGLSEASFNPKPRECGAKVLLRSPEQVDYVEIGICMAQTPGGGVISDKTPEAIAELQKCACLNGGDAIILNNTDEGGIFGIAGYSQQVAKAQGIVILFKNEDE